MLLLTDEQLTAASCVLGGVLDVNCSLFVLQVIAGPVDEVDGLPWYFSLNNRRLWVLKQLREEDLLPDGKVTVRVRPFKSDAERER